MIFRGDEQGFIISVNNETCFALARFFNEFSLAIINGDFISTTSVRIIRAKFGGV